MSSILIRGTMWNIRKLIKKGTYDYALVPEHPNVTINGYVLYHRIVVENNINRLLTNDEEVHHIDGNTHNNDISNLLLLSKEEHRKIHSIRPKTYAEIKCPICNQIRTVLKHNSIDKKQYCCCRSCGRLFQLLTDEEKINRINDCVIKIYKK